MARDLAPPLADQIGLSQPPAPSPLDVLLEVDADRALSRAYRMARAYQAIAREALQRLHVALTENARQRQRIVELCEQLRMRRAR